MKTTCMGIFCCAILPHILEALPHIDVRTNSGLVRGLLSNVRGTEVASFLGVPYARSPEGELRFRPPQKIDPWSGVKEVTQLATACHQTKDTAFPGFRGAEMWNPNTAMSENCLQMNIWVPNGVRNATVMVWFYGGGFFYGSPSLEIYDGRAIASEGKVIVININYRVASFGFLFLDDVEAPGNMGLLDQRLALEWIQENIVFFGGNPESVCLFGESAGGASIFAHVLADSSRRLFKSIVIQSAALDNPWAMDDPSRAKAKSEQFVSLLNCSRPSAAEAVHCLRDKSPEQLNDALTKITVGFMEFPLVIVSQDRGGFFSNDALTALRNRSYDSRLNAMIGVNKDEFSFWSLYYLPKYFRRDEEVPMNEDGFAECIDLALASMPLVMRNGIVHQYLGRNCNSSSRFYRDTILNLLGDYFFTCDALWVADELSAVATNNVYLYQFSQHISTNPWPKWGGVMHGYEIEFVFGLPLLFPDNYTKEEAEFSEKIIYAWTSFAKNG
ncbi:unnamed protein product [Soboliphyme baturini]|uniref:Carboxylic ester hydrolase n=1 Tax=Soboliphyme baturini TaxID=241478 RepID=A0A183ICI3_9BILA|nr:unnamed protein product [Soboliphyme baturini]